MIHKYFIFYRLFFDFIIRIFNNSQCFFVFASKTMLRLLLWRIKTAIPEV